MDNRIPNNNLKSVKTEKPLLLNMSVSIFDVF